MEIEAVELNRRFYDGLWHDARLIEAERFNTWPLVRSLLTDGQRRLEIAPGLRPRLPIAGTDFVDISVAALSQLRDHGASAALGTVTELPFHSERFQLVCALDIVEHVEDDRRALAEISRVTAAGGVVMLSTPLYQSRWTAFDDYVGHFHRYEPLELIDELARHGLMVERSAGYGMQPRSRLAAELTVWFLTRHRRRSMWWYNRVIMPFALRFQGELELHAGMIESGEIDEVLLVCRKAATRNGGR